MRRFIALVAFLSSSALSGHPALAASSPWATETGAKVRLVTTGKPDKEGLIKGALEIDLAPSWKTYWRDPGDAGIPPQIDFSGSSNLSAADIVYPPPHRFSDTGGIWAGYKKPTRFGLILKAAEPSKPMELDAKIFLGLCQSICVPFHAHLSVDPARGADDLMDAAIVAETFAALPAAPSEAFNAAETSKTPAALTVSATLPKPGAAELFVAAPEGYSFGPPRRIGSGNGKALFTVPVLTGGSDIAGGALKIPYTLVLQDGQSVAGDL